MKKIKCIATCMLICLASTLYGCNDSSDTIQDGSNTTEDTTMSTQIVSVTDDSYNNNEEMTTTSDNEEYENSKNKKSANSVDKKITINYKLSSEDFQEKQFSSNTEVDLNRPSTLKGSEVFVGWEENDVITSLQNNTYQAGETVSLTAVTIDTSNTSNAIYNDTVFSSSSEEFVEIPIIIGGDTNYSILDLEVTFDKELFTFDSITYSDDDAACNYTDDGKLLISFVSTSNVTADVNLCNIKLKKNKTDKIETKLHYNIKDIAAWNNDCTDYVPVTYEVLNDLIVLY